MKQMVDRPSQSATGTGSQSEAMEETEIDPTGRTRIEQVEKQKRARPEDCLCRKRGTVRALPLIHRHLLCRPCS